MDLLHWPIIKYRKALIETVNCNGVGIYKKGHFSCNCFFFFLPFRLHIGFSVSREPANIVSRNGQIKNRFSAADDAVRSSSRAMLFRGDSILCLESVVIKHAWKQWIWITLSLASLFYTKNGFGVMTPEPRDIGPLDGPLKTWPSHENQLIDLHNTGRNLRLTCTPQYAHQSRGSCWQPWKSTYRPFRAFPPPSS